MGFSKNILVLAFIFAATTTPAAPAQDDEPYENISQLVIVYAPKKDGNTAFSGFDESTSKLLQAAEKRFLRVVLINTDDFDGPNATELIKNSIAGAVSAQPSIVMLATHGGAIPVAPDKAPIRDTKLSFGQGVSFSKLSTAFEGKPNLKGLVVQACHSDNDKLPTLGKNAVVCATSQHDTTSTSDIGVIYQNTLVSAINDQKIKDFATYVRGGMLAQIESLSKADRRRLLGANEDYAKLPLYGPTGMRVEFLGSKFEIVDPFGNSMKPCYYPKAIDPDQIIDESKLPPWLKPSNLVASLPSKVMPEDAVEAILLSRYSPKNSHLNFYFETHSKNVTKEQNLRVECSNNGEIIVKGREPSSACFGTTVEIGKNCERSFLNVYQTPMVGHGQPFEPQNLPSDASQKQNAKDFCDGIDSSFKTFRDRGVKVEVQDMCIAAQCKGLGNSYSYSIGQCTKSGGRCEATPKGSFVLPSSECYQSTNIKATMDQACTASDGSVAAAGKCFKPAYPQGMRLPMRFNPVQSDDEREQYIALHQQVPSFRCINNKQAKLDKDCCKEHNGVYVDAGQVPKESDYFVENDASAFQTWLALVATSNEHCEKPPQSYYTEGNGAGLGMSGMNGFNVSPGTWLPPPGMHAGYPTTGGFNGMGGGMSGGYSIPATPKQP